MKKTELFAALMATTLLAAPALAQSTQPSTAPATPPMADQKPMSDQTTQQKPMEMNKGSMNKGSMAGSPAVAKTAQEAGQWRTSKLIGLNVYNNNNEKVGDINELITDQDGNIQTLVVGVGGFLGIGEHDVGLAWDQVKFVGEPVRSASGAATTTTGSGTATTATRPATTTTAAREYPDHVVINMTKEQLKALPAFKFASDTSNR